MHYDYVLLIQRNSISKGSTCSMGMYNDNENSLF